MGRTLRVERRGEAATRSFESLYRETLGSRDVADSRRP